MKKTLKSKHHVGNVNSIEKRRKDEAESTKKLKIKSKIKVK